MIGSGLCIIKGIMKTLKVSFAVSIPLAIIVIVALLLSALYWFRGDRPQMIITLALVIPLSFILIGWWRRRLSWDDRAIEYRGFTGIKSIPWDEITEIRLFRAGLKKVLYIGSRREVLVIPLIFSRQEELAQVLQDRSVDDSISPSAMGPSRGEALILWAGALLLIIVFISKVL